MWVISDFMRGDHGTAIKHQQLVQGCRSKGIAAVNGVEAGRFLTCHPCNARGVCWEGFLRSTSGLGTGWVSLGTCSGSLSLMNNIPWVTSRRNPCLKKC